MYAYFEADEPTVLHVHQLIRKGELPTIDEDAKVPVYLGLSTEEGFPHEGHLNFVNNQFNLGTATLQLRGKFPNPKPPVGLRLLAPGQFVRIRVPISATHKALLITQAAVGTDQNEKYIFVVNDQGKVERRAVALGAPRPGLQVIAKGLAAGDRVIIDGLQHVRAGDAVNAKVVPMPEEKDLNHRGTENTEK
jgi:RND family efflux transporter MFP subunit